MEFGPARPRAGATPVEHAMAYAGVQEIKGKPNRGKYIDHWLRRCRLDPDGKGAPLGGYPWCAAFVSCMCEDADYVIRMSASVERLFQENRVLEVPIDQIQIGDILLHFGPLGNHIGFFLRRPTEDTIQTCDGNTNDLGSREGNAVGTPIRPRGYWKKAIRPRKAQHVK